MRVSRRCVCLLSLVVVAALLIPTIACGDWIEGDNYKWLQRPDLVTGTTVDITGRTVADDFLCTQTEDMPDFHFWGIWTGGIVESAVAFQLTIYSDVPATLQDYSRPGTVLWTQTFNPGEYLVREYTTGVYQYNFDVWENVFHQTGTALNPIVYWFAIKAIMPDGSTATLGWLTSLETWNDSAVYYGSTDWLIAADGLAFVITPEPGTLVLLVMGLLGVSVYAWRRRK